MPSRPIQSRTRLRPRRPSTRRLITWSPPHIVLLPIAVIAVIAVAAVAAAAAITTTTTDHEAAMTTRSVIPARSGMSARAHASESVWSGPGRGRVGGDEGGGRLSSVRCVWRSNV